MKILFVISLMFSSFSVFAGCCYTQQGLCCSGACQYQCSEKELDQSVEQISCKDDKKVQESEKDKDQIKTDLIKV